MRKVIAILIIVLLAVTQLAVAAVVKEGQGETKTLEYNPPKYDGDGAGASSGSQDKAKPTGDTSGPKPFYSAAEKEKKQKELKKETKPKPGVDDKYWVADADMKITIDGKEVTVKKGEIYTDDKPPSDSKAWLDIPKDVATSAKKNGAEWDSTDDTFTYEKTSKVDKGMMEDTRTKTKVTYERNPQTGEITTTIVQTAQVCGPGLYVCDGADDWEDIKGGTTVYFETKDKDGNLVSKGYEMLAYEKLTDDEYEETTGMTKEEYEKKFGPGAVYKPVRQGQYYYDAKTETMQIDDKDGKKVYTIDLDGNKKYYNADGSEAKNMDEACASRECTKEQKEEYEKSERKSGDDLLSNAGKNVGDVWELMGFWGTLGVGVRAYYEYKGIAQLTAAVWPSYGEGVAERKAKISQEFCAAAGIQNCVVSTVCGRIFKIKADNVLAGRGPGGKYVSSGALNAERGLPVEVSGMTRVQLVDLLGNVTTIGGKRMNLQDPAFNPKTLGPIKLRFYHVQYSLYNNAAKDKPLQFNIVFKDVNDYTNSSYGEAVREGRWWPEGQTLEHGAGASDDLYKWSATKYDSVCMTFDPKLPSGTADIPRMTDELCTPFVEYAEGATSVPVEAQQAMSNASTSTAPISAVPGATI